MHAANSNCAECRGPHDIRINAQWPLCSQWRDDDADEVEIVHSKWALTADTALRLARYFGTSVSFWVGLQADYDLEEARARLGERLREVRPRGAQGAPRAARGCVARDRSGLEMTAVVEFARDCQVTGADYQWRSSRPRLF